MNVTILCVGKIKEDFFKDAIAEYSKRLSRFCKLEIIEVKDIKIPDNASQKECEQILEKEGELLLFKLPKSGYVIPLCIEGKELSSPELAEKIDSASMESGRITFIIGGSLGMSDAVKSMGNFRLSFGKMTLPHQLMRVVLLEQVYRAFKINAKESYHK